MGNLRRATSRYFTLDDSLPDDFDLDAALATLAAARAGAGA